jgi:hypothetical protein
VRWRSALRREMGCEFFFVRCSCLLAMLILYRSMCVMACLGIGGAAATPFRRLLMVGAVWQ